MHGNISHEGALFDYFLYGYDTFKPMNNNDTSSHRRCSKKFVTFTGKYLCWSFFFIKLQAIKKILLKKAPTHVFSCEHCKIFKNTYFERTSVAGSFCDVDLNLKCDMKVLLTTIQLFYCHAPWTHSDMLVNSSDRFDAKLNPCRKRKYTL